jgi:hypothetical protein
MESETECEQCRKVETPRAKRILREVRVAVLGLSPQEKQQIVGRAYASAYRAMAGITWYEKHKEEYARTGNPIELERMLRHVK